MSLKDIARDWVKAVIGNHVGSNIRRYEWTTYVGELRHNMFARWLTCCRSRVR